MHTRLPPEADGLPARLRLVAATGLVLAISIVVMDGIAAAAVLPRLAADFGIDAASSTWVVNAYQLVMIATMLPLAALGQIVGYRRVYLAGLGMFFCMGLVSALSDQLALLIAARAIQGISAACLMSVNLALMRHVVPARQLGRAIGINAMAVALATTIGPTVAGLVMAVGPWNWVFLLSALLVVGPALIGFFTLPEVERAPRRFDALGAVLNAATFAPLLLALSGIGHGWHPALILGLAATGLGAGYLLVRHMRGDVSPMLPMDLLGLPIFRLSLMSSVCAFGAQMLIFVSLPFYLQSGIGMTALGAGLVFSAWPLALAIVAPVAGILADRFRPGALGLAGLGTMALGMLALALLPQGGEVHPVDIMWRLALCGFGFGLFQTPNNRAIMTSAPSIRSSAASGALGTARLLGQAAGTSVAATVLALTPTIVNGWLVATLVGMTLCSVGAIVSASRGI